MRTKVYIQSWSSKQDKLRGEKPRVAKTIALGRFADIVRELGEGFCVAQSEGKTINFTVKGGMVQP